MASQRLEKWLKAAADQAAHDRPVDLYLTDSRRSFDPFGGRDADETDLHSLDR